MYLCIAQIAVDCCCCCYRCLIIVIDLSLAHSLLQFVTVCATCMPTACVYLYLHLHLCICICVSQRGNRQRVRGCERLLVNLPNQQSNLHSQQRRQHARIPCADRLDACRLQGILRATGQCIRLPCLVLPYAKCCCICILSC